jgi:hypothetical protein
MNPPEPQIGEQIWNSLKIAIQIIAALGPLLLIFQAIRFKRIKKRLIGQHQANVKLVEKRIEVYERMGPKLNDILCFFSYTGNWNQLSPVDIMRIKRELDKEINTTTPLFSDALANRYNSFMQLCFVAHSGWEHTEKIKSLYELRQENNVAWKAEWIPFFDPNNVLEGIKIKASYDELMACFRKELNPL